MKAKGKNKTGPKPIVIDWDLVTKYLQAGCSGVEVAAAIGIHENTLYKRCETDNKVAFVAYLHEKKAHGNTMLRTKQFQVALTGDRTMLVWLGKQRLEQSDKQDIKQTGDLTISVKLPAALKADE